MQRDNGRNRYSSAGKYSRTNRYEEGSGPSEPDDSSNTLPVPILRATRSEDDWHSRRAPEVRVYEPFLGDPRTRQRKAKRLNNDLALATTVAQATTRFYQAAGGVEQALQEVELTHERRVLMPMKVAQERIESEQRLLQTAGDFEAAKEKREVQRVDRVRRRKLDEQEFEVEMLRREAERREQEARIAAATAQLSYAQLVGQRRGEAELAKTEAEAFRYQTEAEGERRKLGEERRKVPQTAPPESDDMPEPLAKHFATERKVKESVGDAARRVQRIHDTAAAQGRDLTTAEIEEIDALENAASAAADSIRRGDASDIEA